MKPLLFVLLFIWPVAPVRAQSWFDGTWKIDMSQSQASNKIDDYLLQRGRYRCTSCDPPLDIKADGQQQKITGEPCYDTVAIEVLDGSTTLGTERRKGKTVGTSKMTVSPDGNSATVQWTESCNAKGDVVSGQLVLSRVGNRPPGAHAVSGSWRVVKRSNLSENALVVSLKLQNDTFSFADPTGQSFSARLDGTETPIKGDLSHTMVSVKRVGENGIQVSNKIGGKLTEVWHFAPSPDGKSMIISIENTGKGTVQRFVAHRQ